MAAAHSSARTPCPLPPLTCPASFSFSLYLFPPSSSPPSSFSSSSSSSSPSILLCFFVVVVFFCFFLGLFIFHSLSLSLFLFNYFILFGFLLVGLKTKTNKGNTYDFWVSVGFFRAQQRSFSQYW